MAQILPAEFNLGGEIGKSLRGGVSSALNTLAQYKLQDVVQRQNQSKLGSAYKQLGIPEAVAGLPEHIQQAYVQEHLMNNPQYGQQQMQQPMNVMQQVTPQQPDQQMMDQLNNLYQKTAPTDASQVIGQAMRQQLGMQQQGIGEGTNILQQMQNRQTPEQQVQQTGGKIAPATLTKRYSIPTGLSGAQRNKYIQDVLKEERAAEKEGRKSSLLARDEINKKYKAAKASAQRIERMSELTESKNLARPGTAALVEFIRAKGWGPDLGYWLTDESQEYEKLIQGFIGDAKAMYGNKMTDVDLKEYMKGVPGLLKSRDGKRRMFHNMKILNDTAILRKKVADMIIKENGGNVPNDLENLIDERADKQLTALSNKFKEGFKKPVKTVKDKSNRPWKVPVGTKFANFVLGKG